MYIQKKILLSVFCFMFGVFFLDEVQSQCCTVNTSTTVTATTKYSGNQNIKTHCATVNSSPTYILYDSDRGIRTRETVSQVQFDAQIAALNASEFTSCDNTWANDPINDIYDRNRYALDAHWGAAMTYDYFLEKHCRDSYDGLGSELLIYIMPLNSTPNTTNSAFWNIGGNVMGFDNSRQTDPFNTNAEVYTSLDVVAHEFGHGVANTAIPSGLNTTSSNKETRLISEGLADIWAICVENYVNQKYGLSKTLWVIAEEPYSWDLANGGPSRCSRRCDVPMYTPVSNNNYVFNDPTTGPPFFYYPFSTQSLSYNALTDQHYLSTIVTRWFYLLTNGDGTSTFPNPTDLNAAIDAAAKIVYRAETMYMHSNTTLLELREMTYKAALDLHPSNCVIVDRLLAAWDEVGVNQGFLPGGNLGGTSASEYLRTTSLDLADFNPFTDATVSSIQSVTIGSTYAMPSVAMEFIGLNNIINSTTVDVMTTTPNPIVFTAGNNITLSASASKQFRVRAGAKVLMRIDKCGVTPADVVPCIISSRTIMEDPIVTDNNEQSKEEWGVLANSVSAITQEDATLKVFPNPSSGRIHIQIESATMQDGRLAIYDIQGKLIHTLADGYLGETLYSYNFEQMPSGIYIVQLINSEGVHSQKVVITK